MPTARKAKQTYDLIVKACPELDEGCFWFKISHAQILPMMTALRKTKEAELLPEV